MWRRCVVVVVLGLAFGAVTTWLNVPPADFVLGGSPRRVASLVLNAGAVWAGMAILGGRMLGSVRLGLLGGPLALIPAVGVYYLLGAGLGSENPGGSPELIAYFGLAAVILGSPLGAVGALSRRRDTLGLLAALVLPVGIGVELVWRSAIPEVQPDPARPAADLVLAALALAGLTLAVSTRLRPAVGSRQTDRRQGSASSD